MGFATLHGQARLVDRGWGQFVSRRTPSQNYCARLAQSQDSVGCGRASGSIGARFSKVWGQPWCRRHRSHSQDFLLYRIRDGTTEYVDCAFVRAFRRWHVSLVSRALLFSADLALNEMSHIYQLGRARRTKHEALQEERAAKEKAAAKGR